MVRTLFTVIEGENSISVDWNPELMDALDRLSPNGELTDRIIEIVEDLLGRPDEEDEP